MDIRETNAQYDEEVGDIYDKCDWCFNIILSIRYSMRIEQQKLYFCSKHCWNMANTFLTYDRTKHNKRTLKDTAKYEQLKDIMTIKYEEIKNFRGY